jgi:hypothetical protein
VECVSRHDNLLNVRADSRVERRARIIANHHAPTKARTATHQAAGGRPSGVAFGNLAGPGLCSRPARNVGKPQSVRPPASLRSARGRHKLVLQVEQGGQLTLAASLSSSYDICRTGSQTEWIRS